MKVEDTLSLFEVQSILDVRCSCSVHSGRFRPLESYRSALLCGFDIGTFVFTLDSKFILKHC